MICTHRTFARARTTNDSDALTGFELEIDVRKDIGSIKIIANGHITELDLTSSWP